MYKSFEFPLPVPLKKKLSDIIDFKTLVDEKYYYTEGKYKGDIYEQLVEEMDDENAIYQWRRKYVRKNKSGVVPTLTAIKARTVIMFVLLRLATVLEK